MYSFVLESEAMNALPVGVRYELVTAMCDMLVTLNTHYLETFPETPNLYDAGVRYIDQTPRPDPFTQGMKSDLWRDIPRILETGGGACEDLASWRVAELNAQGDIAARIDVATQPDANGNVLYHILVRRGDGLVEDPSALLGMPTPQGYALADIF